MRRFMKLLLVLIFSVWLGLRIAKNPGLAFFSYGQWSIEMPLWLAALGLMAGLFFFYLVWDLLSGLRYFFYRCSNGLRWHRRSKAYSKTHQGFIELMEGRWKKAENHLIAGIDPSEAPLMNYLALAKAAHEQHAYDKRDSYLRKAHAAAPQEEIAIGLAQAHFQIHQGQLEQALATLTQLRTIAPRQGSILKLLKRVYVRLADWKQALKLLPDLHKARTITSEQWLFFEKKYSMELLKCTANHSDKLAALHELWRNLPRQLQKDPQLLSCYARQLMHYPEKTEETVKLIEASLKKSWNADLVKLYGLLNTANPSKQLLQAENWLKRYPNQASLFLTLGRLAVRCQLWGKARNYFEESLKLHNSAEACFEYGKLLEQLNDPLAALRVYKEGLGFGVCLLIKE